MAKNETKLLDNQKVTLPTTDVASFHQQINDIDNVSMEIMLKYHPAYTEENIALRTVGDGHCLYRTISKNLMGTEQYHKLISLETALEIIIFSDNYDAKSKTKLDCITDTRIVTSNVNKLIEDAIELGSYSELAHLYAVGAFIGQPIRSYYPPQIHPELTPDLSQELLLAETLNCQISYL